MTLNFKHILAGAAMAAAFLASAQTEADNSKMYLIKGDRVVGKYAVEDVDYVSFNLPEGIKDENLWLTIGNVGKNNITYTVNTADANTTYAHGIVSEWDMWYAAMDTYGDYVENLNEEEVAGLLQGLLPYVAYKGVGAQQYTLTDWDLIFNYHINVTPGTTYYVCAWEVDPVTEKPYDLFVYDTVTTLAPEQSTANLSVNFVRQNEEGLAFDIQGSDDILYVTTAFGEKNMMEIYTQYYGADLLFGVFGQSFTIASLQGENEINSDIEAATWPAYEDGEYILMVRAYDAQGNMTYAEATATFTETKEDKGPEIKIWSKTKGDGKVSVNFEITPSNVEEAYVRMMEMNAVDDRLNIGYELYELAMGGDSTDITAKINTEGEYTFKADNIDDKWYTILIYAKDKTGARTAMRLDFNTVEGSNWYVGDPVHAPSRPSKNNIAARMMHKGHKPTINKVK